jgi:hypothetical protein
MKGESYITAADPVSGIHTEDVAAAAAADTHR